MFTNCRAGMMFWGVGTICFAHKAMEVNDGVLPLGMFVNVALQLIYVTKFFHWEMGYMCSMDIQVDKVRLTKRAGEPVEASRRAGEESRRALSIATRWAFLRRERIARSEPGALCRSLCATR